MATLKNTEITSTDKIDIPKGTTAQRPGSPSAGMIRYNTDYNTTEYYNGTAWRPTDDSILAWSTGADIVRVGNDIAHIWRNTGTHSLRVQYPGTVRVLVIGGGGAGGVSSTNCSAGGGGAGGMIETTSNAAVGTITVTVGAGGLGGNPGSDGAGDNSFVGRDGSNSTFGSLTALGGGGGGGGQTRTNGRNGGSAGGGAHPNGGGGTAQQPSSASGGYGNNGGAANNSGPEWGGGGGGGASETGQPGTANYGGLGGSGRMSGISGTMRWYAGGGGGGGCQTAGGHLGPVTNNGGGRTAAEGGLGGGGNANQQTNSTNGERNTGGGGSAGSYNGGGQRSADGGNGVVVVRYRSRIVIIGNSSDNPAESAAQIKSWNPNATSGLYWIKPTGYTGSAQQIYCDMDYDGGGWMLVSSNYATDTTIPSGTSRQSTSYELDRATVLGTPSPNSDYIIGAIINDLPFSEARVWGFGFNSTSNTFVWPTNLGGNVRAFWGLTTSGASRLTEVRDRQANHVYITGSGYGGGGGYGDTRQWGGVSSNARYFTLDGVKQDRVNGGYTANANQTTIGGVGVQGSNGDPTSGCYLGHGSSEGNYEGWYDWHNNSSNSTGYTTWVR